MTRKQKKTLIRIIVSVVLTGVAWAVDEIFGFEGWKALLLSRRRWRMFRCRPMPFWMRF